MLDNLIIYISENSGKVIGVALGLIVSILFISFGFWRTLFIVFCIFAGYQIGKMLDENTDLELWMNYLFKAKKK
jgi:uncharacterized membrane protein